MPNENNTGNKIHKVITFILGLAFLIGIIFGGVYLVTHFKQIAVSLNLPFTPGDWYPDHLVSEPNTTNNEEDLSSIGVSYSNEMSVEWFDEYLSNFIYLDLPPFNKPSEIKNEDLIYFGVITAANSQKEPSYAVSKDNETIIPANDVEKSINDFFEGVTVTHMGIENFVKYSVDKKEYLLPAIGLDSRYRTIISNVNNISLERTEITVNYYNRDYQTEKQKTLDDKPLKTMVVTLLKDEGKYKIISLKQK